MNNNRGSNRRRGRGNNRQQGGNQGNRIDSRARGNAPQLLEKYRKLAHDASLNGDRVQAEYYLQFADHYFRVVADSRVKDDPRGPQQGNREQSYDEEFRDDDDQYNSAPRDNGRENDNRAPRENGRENGRLAGGRDVRTERPNDGRREQAGREPDERDGADEERDEFEPVENPFTRQSRDRRPDGERPARPARPRREPANAASANRAPANQEANEGPQEDEGPRFDPASLPPSISVETEAPKPRRTRARKPRATGNENGGDKGGEELETVS